MANLFFEFQKLIKGERPDENLLVPLLIWASGSENNIQVCQKINKKFYNGNRNIFIDELTLNNRVRHVIRYPKVAKKDDKIDFFYEDLCKYMNWTRRELEKNISVIDLEAAKVRIAAAFGYDNKKRRLLKLEGIEYGKKKNTRRTNNRRIEKAETDTSGSQKGLGQFKEC